MLTALAIFLFPTLGHSDEPFRIERATSASDKICVPFFQSIEHGYSPEILQPLPQWTWLPPPHATYRYMQVDADNDGTIDMILSREGYLSNQPTYSSLWILRGFKESAEAAVDAVSIESAAADELALQNFPLGVDANRFAPSGVFRLTESGFALPDKANFRLFSNVDVAIWRIEGRNYIGTFHLYTKTQKYQNAALVQYGSDGRLTPLCTVSFQPH